MEHNLAGYAKYYSCGHVEISKSSEFTREIDHNKRDFSRHWQENARNKLCFELRTII